VSPSTFNAHIKFLAALFKALEVKAGLTENVWALITRKAKAVDQGRRNLTEEELRNVIGKATGNLRVMIVVGLFTGLRLGDVVNLRWDEIDHDRFKGEAKPGFIVTKPMKTSRYGKRLETPIHGFLRPVLDQHRGKANGEYLFPEEREHYLQSTAKLTKRFQDLFRLCGIQTVEEPKNKERRRVIVRVGFHSLRHSFVSLCAKAGAPQHILQKMVGHSSPAMTEYYTHVADEEKKLAIALLPDIGTEAASNGALA
jgi:integrase